MKSKTKTLPTDAVLRDMLKQAGLDSAGVQFRLLGDGMFNAVFAAETNPPVVKKIAPRPQVPVMTYERDMLATELYWYDQIRQHTEITVPNILYSDPAGNLCGAPWVVMERLPGVHRDKCPLPSAEKHRRTAEMLAQIHNVSGTGYGYVQNGLYENWADAYISMIENLLADARRMGKTSRRGQRLLAYARQYRAVLATAPCVMVNFDLWSSNILWADKPGLPGSTRSAACGATRCWTFCRWSPLPRRWTKRFCPWQPTTPFAGYRCRSTERPGYATPLPRGCWR